MRTRFIILTALLLAACSMDRRNETDETSDQVVLGIGQDDMIYGILQDTRDDCFLIRTDSGDTLWVRMLTEGGVIGDPVPGSRFAYQAADDRVKARFAVNLSMLMGEWVEPSALAEGTYCGVELSDGGIALSINSQTTEYVAWQLQDSRLLLTSTPLGLDINELTTDTFTIKMLTPDSLILRNPAVNFYFCRKSSVRSDEDARPYSDGEEDDMMSDFDALGQDDNAADSTDILEDGLMY